jgi:hypothetical protein
MERLEALIAALKRGVLAAFWFTLAVIFLIESWIWDHVKDWLRRLERALGLERLEPWLAAFVARLSPEMTLALFAIPMIAVLPFKFAALALLTNGHVVLGLVFIFLVKSLTLGVEAFLFDICRDKLLQMEWFGRFYSLVLDVRVCAAMLVTPLKSRAAEAWRRIRDYAASFSKGEGQELIRRIARLRDAIRFRPPA